MSHEKAVAARGPVAAKAPDRSPDQAGPKLRTDLGEPRLFSLIRTDDVSGVSGEGRVADGVQWPDGTVTVRWRTTTASTVFFSCLADAEAIHGHDGRTVVSWSDVGTVQAITRPCAQSLDFVIHGGHPWTRACGTSIYEYWCQGWGE